MIRLLVSLVVNLIASAIGLLVAAALLDSVSVTTSGFLLVVVIFAVTQTVLGPFIAKVVASNARAFLGGVGLLTTFVALLVASALGDSLQIDGVDGWVLATLIVWLAAALATVIIPIVLVKMGIEQARERRAD